MAYIETVPNQLVIKIKKEQCNEDTNYMKVNMTALESASKDLKAGAFKLWIYFAKNQSEYTFALSPQHVKNIFGINKTQYNSAKAELINKGYLKQMDRNFYHFYEIPITDDTDVV